jgi:hypothetical protein
VKRNPSWDRSSVPEQNPDEHGGEAELADPEGDAEVGGAEQSRPGHSHGEGEYQQG